MSRPSPIAYLSSSVLDLNLFPSGLKCIGAKTVTQIDQAKILSIDILKRFKRSAIWLYSEDFIISVSQLFGWRACQLKKLAYNQRYTLTKNKLG